jgi:hypothetical protein
VRPASLASERTISTRFGCASLEKTKLLGPTITLLLLLAAAYTAGGLVLPTIQVLQQGYGQPQQGYGCWQSFVPPQQSFALELAFAPLQANYYQQPPAARF